MFYSCEIIFLEGLEFIGDRNYMTLFNGYSLGSPVHVAPACIGSGYSLSI
jgi:hypothetical protein